MRIPNVRQVRYVGQLAAAVIVSLVVLSPSALAVQSGTPAAVHSCDSATPAATPAMDHGGMSMSTPMASMAMDVEFDQLYIDMMIPHHGSVVALAEAALPRLTDPRLVQIAETIIETQTAEQAEMESYRQQWYGSAEPMPMDMHAMEMMMQAMPGMGSSMTDMANVMSAEWQVATFCAAADPDLAFIDQVIPHHQMAIASSRDALERAVHPEIVAFAQRVIDDQQREIAELGQIRSELAR
jgi:uncharacterized protein (DUF305 family)